jgi:phosphatidylglycerophosphate synthase
LLAVLTAYVRTLAVSLAAPMNFQGPMAKQHRMALLTAACVFTALENYIGQSHYALFVAMIILILGCLITLYRRTLSVYHFLEHHDRT